MCLLSGPSSLDPRFNNSNYFNLMSPASVGLSGVRVATTQWQSCLQVPQDGNPHKSSVDHDDQKARVQQHYHQRDEPGETATAAMVASRGVTGLQTSMYKHDMKQTNIAERRTQNSSQSIQAQALSVLWSHITFSWGGRSNGFTDLELSSGTAKIPKKTCTR